jgi:hypothetical protein
MRGSTRPRAGPGSPPSTASCFAIRRRCCATGTCSRPCFGALLQSGARHLAADGPVAILDAVADLDGLERQILASATETRGGWASRLLAPLERAATYALMTGPIGPSAVGTAAALLTALGAGALAYHWLWTGLIALLVATPFEGIAARLARLRMQDDVGRSWWSHLLPVLAGAAMVGLAYALVPAHGWGMVLLAFTTLAFLIALGIETEGRQVRGSLLLAEAKGMVWLLLPFGIFDLWNAGLATLFAYARGRSSGRNARSMPNFLPNRISDSLTLWPLRGIDGRRCIQPTGEEERRCAAAAGRGARALCRRRH